jgi:DNA-directed RNA polymerase specialized sigma24 family protein
MPAEGSISVWIDRLRTGDPAAPQALWERYFSRLVVQARQMLRGQTRAADEEDVALSAFDSFCKGAEQGRFPRLEDRDDLWQLLLLLTVRKAVNLLKHEARGKRGGGQVRHASALATESEQDAFANALRREPTPELAVEVAEECRRLLDGLGDAQLRAVAQAKMEGYSNAEIAAQLGKSVGTVERKLQLIRKAWEHEARAAGLTEEPAG